MERGVIRRTTKLHRRHKLRNKGCVKMDLLKTIDDWVQKGFEVTYDIVNQFENGYGNEVISGNMPKFTYTFYIYENEEDLWLHSVDTLEEGYTLSLKWLSENR